MRDGRETTAAVCSHVKYLSVAEMTTWSAVPVFPARQDRLHVTRPTVALVLSVNRHVVTATVIRKASVVFLATVYYRQLGAWNAVVSHLHADVQML